MPGGFTVCGRPGTEMDGVVHTTMEDVARARRCFPVARLARHPRQPRRSARSDASASSPPRRELGYSPNPIARNLASRQSSDVAVLLNDLHNPFFAEIVRWAAARRRADRLPAAARRRERSAPDRAGGDAWLPRVPRRRHRAGQPAPPRGPDRVRRCARFPSSSSAGSVRADGVDSVMTDERVGARLAVDHLAGARAPAHRAHRRRSRRRRRPAAAGLPQGDGAGWTRPRTSRCWRGDFTERAGTEAAAALAARAACRRRSSPPTTWSPSAPSTPRAPGIGVPADVSVIGYDNTFFARLRHISLTTIDQPRAEMGQDRPRRAHRPDRWRAPDVGAGADDSDARASRHHGPTPRSLIQ